MFVVVVTQVYKIVKIDQNFPFKWVHFHLKYSQFLQRAMLSKDSHFTG